MTVDKNADPVMFVFGTLETGGSESKFVGLANRLTEKGKSVHVAYLGPPETLLPQLADIQVVKLDRKGKWSLRAFRTLSRYVQKFGVSTIVSVNLYPLCYALPLAYFRRNGIPKVIASINTSELLSPRDRAFMRIYVPLLRRCDQNIFGSERQQRDWLKNYNLPRERARVIYNGVDANVFDLAAVPQTKEEIRASLNIPTDASVIVCVSQLRPEKAHRNLLQAVATLEHKYKLKPHVVLVGDGSERSAVVELSQRLALDDRIHLIGLADDVRPYLKASDIFALTSIAVETFSNAALEATAMGLPVVISDVGGAREMFPTGSSGIIYPRDDIDSLASALAKKLQVVQSGDVNKDEIRHSVLQRFSIAAMDSAWTDAIWQQTQTKGLEPGMPLTHHGGE